MQNIQPLGINTRLFPTTVCRVIVLPPFPLVCKVLKGSDAKVASFCALLLSEDLVTGAIAVGKNHACCIVI